MPWRWTPQNRRRLLGLGSCQGGTASTAACTPSSHPSLWLPSPPTAWQSFQYLLVVVPHAHGATLCLSCCIALAHHPRDLLDIVIMYSVSCDESEQYLQDLIGIKELGLASATMLGGPEHHQQENQPPDSHGQIALREETPPERLYGADLLLQTKCSLVSLAEGREAG